MLCIFSLSSFAQGEVDTEAKILFSDDFSGYIGLNTNGFGLGFRYGKYVDYLHKRSYSVQYVTLRSPKEVRFLSSYGMTIYGKQNSVGALQAMIGRKNEKFSKLDKNSVAVFWNYDAGLSLAVEKPVYYHVLYPDGNDVIERFDASNYTKYGKASFAYGFGEMRFIPGLVASTSVEFDFSKRKRLKTSAEIGMNVQTYLRRVVIMSNNENSWCYVTLFLNLRFGKMKNEF